MKTKKQIKYIKYYSKNKDKIKAKQRAKYKSDPIYKEKHNASARNWFQNNKAKIRIRARKTYAKNKDAINARKRARYRADPVLRAKRSKWGSEYFQKNKKHCAKRIMSYSKRTYKNPQYRLAQNCMMRIKIGLKTQGAKRLYSYKDLIGLGWKDLQLYLETKFQPGMKWSHHTHQGKHKFKAFHLHHKQPINSFDLHYGSNQLKAFNYKNILPIFISDHYVESSRYLLKLEQRYRLCKQRAAQYKRALDKYI